MASKYQPEHRINAAYNPQGLKNYVATHGSKELRAEYARLRDIAKDRIAALNRAGFDNDYTEAIRRYNLRSLKDITTDRELIYHTSALDAWLSTKRSSVREQKAIRKKAIATLQLHGYSFVNQDNFNNFTALMEELRKRGLLEIFYAEEEEEELTEEIVDESENAEDIKNAVNRYQKEKEKNISRAKLKRRKAQAERERKAALKAGKKVNTQKSARNAKKAGKRGRKGKRRR